MFPDALLYVTSWPHQPGHQERHRGATLIPTWGLLGNGHLSVLTNQRRQVCSPMHPNPSPSCEGGLLHAGSPLPHRKLGTQHMPLYTPPSKGVLTCELQDSLGNAPLFGGVFKGMLWTCGFRCGMPQCKAMQQPVAKCVAKMGWGVPGCRPDILLG